MLRQLKVGDKEYKLSPKENELLKLLCIHRNDFMPRDLALRKIWKKKIILPQEVWTFILPSFVSY
jgi:DNA-binding winged helix-turn-helix (wHTH) protein